MGLYLSALLLCLKPLNLLMIFAMVCLGIVFGAIPGLSATLGIALLLPVTFGLSTETSFILLLAIWIGGVSGSFISAVLIGIPGSSSSIATCFDGYPMTLKGESNKALAVGITASFLGTFFSVILATILSPIIADFGTRTDARMHRHGSDQRNAAFCFRKSQPVLRHFHSRPDAWYVRYVPDHSRLGKRRSQDARSECFFL